MPSTRVVLAFILDDKHENAAVSYTGLPVVEQGCLEQPLQAGWEVGVVEQDRRRLTSELQGDGSQQFPPVASDSSKDGIDRIADKAALTDVMSRMRNERGVSSFTDWLPDNKHCDSVSSTTILRARGDE